MICAVMCVWSYHTPFWRKHNVYLRVGSDPRCGIVYSRSLKKLPSVCSNRYANIPSGGGYTV